MDKKSSISKYICIIKVFSFSFMEQRLFIIFAIHIADAVLKYSRLKRRFVVCLGLKMYSSTHLRTSSYNFPAFSGIDFPERISSPVIGFKSTRGVFKVGSI